MIFFLSAFGVQKTAAVLTDFLYYMHSVAYLEENLCANHMKHIKINIFSSVAECAVTLQLSVIRLCSMGNLPRNCINSMGFLKSTLEALIRN